MRSKPKNDNGKKLPTCGETLPFYQGLKVLTCFIYS